MHNRPQPQPFKFNSASDRFENHVYTQQSEGSDVYVYENDTSIKTCTSLNALPFPDSTSFEREHAKEQFVTEEYNYMQYPSWRTRWIFQTNAPIPPQMGWCVLQDDIMNNKGEHEPVDNNENEPGRKSKTHGGTNDRCPLVER